MNPLKFNLDIMEDSYETCDLMQDYDYNMSFIMTYNYTNLDLTGVIIQVQMQKADSKFIIQTEKITVVGNVINVEIDKDLTRVSGKAKLQIVLVKNNKTFGSWIIKCKIKESAINDNDGQSENKVTITEALTNKITEANVAKVELDKSIANGDTSKMRVDIDKNSVDIKNNSAQLAETRRKISYKELQTNLLSNFYKKTRLGESVIVSCQGDSMFYGYDVTSNDIRPIDTSLTDDNTAHTKTRASKTFPESLQEQCDKLFGKGRFNILNRGYSGDTVITGKKHWYKNVGANLTLFGYGINDSRGSVPDSGDLDVFLKGYRILIEQQLDFGSAVVLLTPLKARFHYGNATITDVFTGAINQLGVEYGIPVIDGDKLLQGYNFNFYSDSTHLNGKGYEVVGFKIASIFIGNGLLQPNYIETKKFMSTRRTTENLVFDDGVTLGSIDNSSTPSEGLENQGFVASIPTGKSLTYSIFAERENICVIPSFYHKATTGTVNVGINGGIQQSDWNTDYIKNITITEDENVTGTQILDYTLNGVADDVLWEDDYKLNGIEPICVTGLGWNTITITNNTNYSLTFSGLLLEPLENFYDNKGFCLISTHSNYGDRNEIISTRIKQDFLLNMLGLSNRTLHFYWNPLINITVSNTDASVFDTYQFRFGNVSGLYNYGMIESTQIISTSPKRLIKNITFDSTNKEYVIEWSGDLTMPSMINFNIASSGSHVEILQPTNAIPTPIKGGRYFDKRTDKFKKCVDGTNWIDD